MNFEKGSVESTHKVPTSHFVFIFARKEEGTEPCRANNSSSHSPLPDCADTQGQGKLLVLSQNQPLIETMRAERPCPPSRQVAATARARRVALRGAYRAAGFVSRTGVRVDHRDPDGGARGGGRLPMEDVARRFGE